MWSKGGQQQYRDKAYFQVCGGLCGLGHLGGLVHMGGLSGLDALDGLGGLCLLSDLGSDNLVRLIWFFWVIFVVWVVWFQLIVLFAFPTSGEVVSSRPVDGGLVVFFQIIFIFIHKQHVLLPTLSSSYSGLFATCQIVRDYHG